MNAARLLRSFSIRTRMLGAIVMVLSMFALVGALVSDQLQAVAAPLRNSGYGRYLEGLLRNG